MSCTQNALSLQSTEKNTYASVFFIMSVALLMITPNAVIAAGDPGLTSPLGDVMCLILNWVYGPLGRSICVLGIMIIGIGGCLGKVSWGLALTVGTGVATVFGAVPIAGQIMNSAGNFSMKTICTVYNI